MWPLLFVPQLLSDYTLRLDNVVFQLLTLTQFNMVLETHRDKTKDAVVKKQIHTHDMLYTHTYVVKADIWEDPCIKGVYLFLFLFAFFCVNIGLLRLASNSLFSQG